MNTIDFTRNGGFRFKQFTLRKMQETYFETLKAFIAFCQVPESGSYIISGMQIDGDNITEGYCYIDGELCRFSQSEGNETTKIKKNVVIQSLGFKNGNNEDVFRFVNAQTDEATGQAYSTFIRVSPVFDALYLRFSQIEKEKLAGIETGAEKNVKADWNETTSTADSFIQNKPLIISPLQIGTLFGIADINGNANYPVTFEVPVTTAEYLVLGSFRANQPTNGNNHNNLTFCTRNHTVNGFDLLIHETVGTAQNVSFDFMVIPNPN